jgi:hypothetical protein
MTLDLSGPAAKLDRAEYHLDTLIDEVRQVMELNGQPMETRYNPLDETHSFIFKEAQPIPSTDWGVILGDAVNNMRSALDHLVAVLVADANHQVHSTHQFPIFDTPNDWQRRVINPPRNRRGQLDFVDASYIAIIEEVQPYQPTTGLPSLAVLRSFSNTDKHRLIHAVQRRLTASPTVSAVQTIPLTIVGVTYSDPDSTLENGTEVASVRCHFDLTANSITGEFELPPNSEMNMRIDMKATVVFGPPGQEDTRIGDFKNCLTDCRALLARF